MSNRMRIVLVVLLTFLLGYLVGQRLPILQAQAGQAAKGQTSLHGFDATVRPVGINDRSDLRVKKFGVEVMRDENNGNVIYMTETGSIAVLPAK